MNNVNVITITINATIQTPTALTVELKSSACLTATVIVAICNNTIIVSINNKLIIGKSFNIIRIPGAYAKPNVRNNSPVFDSVSGSGSILVPTNAMKNAHKNQRTKLPNTPCKRAIGASPAIMKPCKIETITTVIIA